MSGKHAVPVDACWPQRGEQLRSATRLTSSPQPDGATTMQSQAGGGGSVVTSRCGAKAAPEPEVSPPIPSGRSGQRPPADRSPPPAPGAPLQGRRVPCFRFQFL